MTTEKFNLACGLITDLDLIESAKNQISQLCKSGGQSFQMSVPVKITDTDIILSELVKRFETRVNSSVSDNCNTICDNCCDPLFVETDGNGFCKKCNKYLGYVRK